MSFFSNNLLTLVTPNLFFFSKTKIPGLKINPHSAMMKESA